MRRDPDYFDGVDPVLLYIAKRLKESLALEEVLTASGIDYGVEADHYQGGVIFRSQRVGAFFYVRPDSERQARTVLESHGYTPHSE
jgi:hypothetical protein